MSTLAQLTPEQRQVVDQWGRGMAVLAGAGSGKTTTLVVKCQELMNRNPEARIAAVSFTEKSASDLREKLSTRLPGEDPLRRHWVATIHGLCSSIIREFPMEAGFEGEETMMDEAASRLLWQEAVSALWFDELPEALGAALDRLLERERREELEALLLRVRELESFGVLSRLRGLEAEDLDPSAVDLKQVSQFVLERYTRLKRRRGQMDFGDLEMGADRALEHEAVQQALQKRFDLVLVDEFQDTNPLQARILWRVAKPGATNLCVVGDPKQSIYRFRDADVSVFEELCSRLPVRVTLTWNFRSRPGIIHFSNQVCAPLFEQSQLEYVPLDPKREVHPEGLVPVQKLEVDSPQALARAIRAEVDRGIPLGSFALLLRKIRGNEDWLKALRAEGIPVAVGSGGLFWAEPRVRELSALIRWWDLSGNALSGAVFLRSPWVGVDDATLDAWLRQDPSLKKAFFESGHRLAALLRPLQGRKLRPAELILRLLEDPLVERDLGVQALGLWHRLEEWSSRGLDFHAVALELQACLEEERREAEVPPPRGQGQLTVLTIHGSKGLEFDHVVLIDLPARSARPGDSPLLYWDRKEGAYLVRRDEDGERDSKNTENARWKDLEKAKALAESKRLFYVALTRARERLWLVYPPSAKAPKELETGWEETLGKDYWRGWIEASSRIPAYDLASASVSVSASVSAPSSELSASSAQNQVNPSQDGKLSGSGEAQPSEVRARSEHQPQVLLHRPRFSVTEWNLLGRCPRAFEWSRVRPRLGERRKDEDQEQTELGTEVHRLLELGDFEGLRSIGAEAAASWAASDPLMLPPDPARGRRVWKEFSFEVAIAGETLVGSMDRLVLDAGRFTVVDFKFTKKLKREAELFEAYGNQVRLYARALELLEPAAQGKTDVVIVNLTGEEAKSWKLPLEKVGQDPDRLAAQAAAIVAGSDGMARVSSLCGTCPHRRQCPEAQAQ